MTSSEYRNTIMWTLSTRTPEGEDILTTARRIFNNLGVAFPQGDLETALNVLGTGDYMGWTECSPEQARYCANNGYTAIGIKNDNIVIILPDRDKIIIDTAVSDVEHSVASELSAITEAELVGMRFFAYASLLNSEPVQAAYVQSETETTSAMYVTKAVTTCESCETSCEISCQTCDSCQTVCQSACQDACESSCQVGCQVSCQSCDSCQDSCEIACQDTCESSCQVGCQVACQTCDSCQSGETCDNGDSSSVNPTNTYTITYDLNGGSGIVPEPQVVNIGETATAAIITHPQYCYILDHTFDGWNTAADGSGTSYLQGAAIENINSNITLYAQFTYVVDETV